MRIAIATRKVARNDGQGRVAYEIAREALRRGDDVTLLASVIDDDLADAGARWIPIPLKLTRLALVNDREIPHRVDRELDRLARAGERFDITLGFGYTLTRPHQVNVAQFVHDAWWRSPVHTWRVRRDLYGVYQGVYTLANRRWERLSFRRADVVVAASHLVRRELLACGVPSERIRVILNAVDPREFHPAAADRSALGLPEQGVVMLFAGDIRTPRKNLDTVLRAMPSAPDLHLAVVGALDGSPYPAMAARLGLSSRVHFLGFRRDMAALMRAVDLFVFPSRYEPFGIVVLEAMASGVPVVIAETVGAAEVVTRDCGVVLPNPDDAAQLAAALCRLGGDPDLRRRMGRAARAVAESHDWHRMASAYLSLFQETAPTRQGGRREG